MFQNRQQAAELLSEKLAQFKERKGVIVLGIPRGGVVVAAVLADRLTLPLDIVVVKKLSAPSHPELAIGALGPENTVYWDNRFVQKLKIDKKAKEVILSEKSKELKSRLQLLQKGKSRHRIKGKTILLVDDGVATGATSIVAGQFLKKKGAHKIILVTPVIAEDTLGKCEKAFDAIIYLEAPREFHAVGEFYEAFPQVEDAEVKKLLATSA